MDKVIVVKTIFLHHMKFYANIDKVDVRVFTSRETAEKFLEAHRFIHGFSCYFKGEGWYHMDCIRPKSKELPRLIYAEVKELEVDGTNNDYCSECSEYLK
ncbi:MAG: hypothetical protein J6D27_10105 [Ruminiclostridium sp.]|nr:hypothetical protein [Ruminiclostridium sp.]